MIFPRKKLILPCHKNGYLQSASDARKYRDRFKRNPLAKVADMFIPKPLRMSPGYPCCCETDDVICEHCSSGYAPLQFEVTFSNISSGTCESCTQFNDSFILDYNTYPNPYCLWVYLHDICEYQPGWGQILLAIYADYIQVQLINSNVSSVFFRLDFEELNCKTISDLDIPRTVVSSTECDFSSAVCSITAL